MFVSFDRTFFGLIFILKLIDIMYLVLNVQFTVYRYRTAEAERRRRRRDRGGGRCRVPACVYLLMSSHCLE